MKNTKPWWLYITVAFFLILGLLEYAVDSGDKPAIIEYPIAQVFMLFVLLLIIAVSYIVRAIENVMFHTLSKEAQERYLSAQDRQWEWTWAKKTYKKLLGSKPIEAEGEIILDHNYDGIRELDNKLPPWWVYMFYATIVFGLVYMLRFHVFGGYDQDLEFEREIAEARAEIEEYKKTAKDLIDANTVELLTDASDIKAGETIFVGNCAVCHKVDGGGSIGPNLTDDYWILGGGIKNVFNTISEGGRDGKGMVAWKTNLKPSEMAQVASYVLSMHGTNPADAKAPEGEIWIDPNAPVKEVEVEQIDSTTIKVIMDDEDTDAPLPSSESRR